MSTRNLSVSLLALALTAGALPALDGGGRVRDPEDRWRAQLASMSAALAPFAEDTWPAIAGRFDGDPGAEFNARLVMVAISLANADVARFELGVGLEWRVRAIERLEDVVVRQAEWTDRRGSGGAAVYLAMTVRRLRAECDVGDEGGRVEALARVSDDILLSEAVFRETEGIMSLPEDLADASAAFVGAAVLLPSSDETSGRESAGLDLGARALYGCPSPETVLFASEAALSYQVARRGVPTQLTRVPALAPGLPRGCKASRVWSASESISPEAASLDDRTKAALSASRNTAVLLMEHFLWVFPPAAGCPTPDPDPME